MYLKARRRSTTIGELVSLPGPKFVSFFALKSTFRTCLGAGPSGLEPEYATEAGLGVQLDDPTVTREVRRRITR